MRRRIDAAGLQIEADRQADRTFLIEVIGQAIGEALEEVHARIDELEHDLLGARGLLHEHSLAVRAMLPDPSDDYAPRLPRVRVKAGSRKITDRMPNRVPLKSEASMPWFNDGP